jgi:hypothetical protein
MGFLTKDLPPALCAYPIDVFVSYSHGTFAGRGNTKLKQWSQQLAEDLREELIVSCNAPGRRSNSPTSPGTRTPKTSDRGILNFSVRRVTNAMPTRPGLVTRVLPWLAKHSRRSPSGILPEGRERGEPDVRRNGLLV